MTMPSTLLDRVAAAVCGYAERFHAAVPERHHVASPLGAWMLLALVAPAAGPTVRERLEGVLGLPADEAAAAVRVLLADPHPAVASAVALWTAQGLERPRYDVWASTLPPTLERDVLPDQAAADRWAREHTFGLVEEFPVSIRPDTVSVLVSALATKVRWVVPFDVEPAARLRSAWSDRVDAVLVSPRSGHRVGVVRSTVGHVGVHVATSADGLAVVSVVAAADVPRGDVLAAAHDVARAVSEAPWGPLPGAEDVFGLPLGEGAAWTVSQERRPVVGGRAEHAVAVMPAWSARTDVDLLSDDGFGFADAAGVLVDLLRPLPAPGVSARQSAVARYTSTGFEAAAVTAMATLAGARMPEDGLLRTLEVRFGRPYAVVAVPTAVRGALGSEAPVWHGIPVFSAWVEDPVEAVEPMSVG